MFNFILEIVKDELYALRCWPENRRIKRALKDPNSMYSINLAKFVEEQKNK